MSKSPQEVGFQLSFSKAELRKVVSAFPGREIKKGLETLYERVDKHFCEEEGLLQVVWRGIQEGFIEQHAHFTDLIHRCYPETEVELPFTIADLLSYFSDIARAH